MNYSLQSNMRSWERHQAFEKWKSIQTVKLVCGEKSVGRIPPLPSEYVEYASRWLEKEKDLVKESKELASLLPEVQDSPRM